MDELTDAQLNHLQQDVNNGLIIRSFCSHAGFKLYKDALDARIQDKKNIWLKGSDEEARIERIRAQGIQIALDILKQFMLLGDRSAKILNNDIPTVPEQ